MPEQNWLESRKKKSRRYVFIIFLIAATAALIFFSNNRELLFPKSRNLSPITSAPSQTKPSARGSSSNPGVSAPTAAAKNHPSVAATDSVLIEDFFCGLSGNKSLRIVLSLNLVFPSGALKREVLLKREDLKVMVQKIVAGKSMNELTIDSLRDQTKRAMNRILEKGAISDVEFRNFNIEKVQ